jgi:hypothetical protein
MEALEICEMKHVRNWETSAVCHAEAFQTHRVIKVRQDKMGVLFVGSVKKDLETTNLPP